MSVLISTRRQWVICLWVVLSLLAVSGFRLSAQTAISNEYQIKAVFLFNFAQFVQWPSSAFTSPDEPFRIGILGDDPFDGFLDETVHGEKVDGHPLTIERFESVEDVKHCQILFVSRSEMGHLESIFSSLKGHSVLTVGDTEDFVQRGGVIHFKTENNKIRLRISPEAAKRADLIISSKILRLAEIVDTEN